MKALWIEWPRLLRRRSSLTQARRKGYFMKILPLQLQTAEDVADDARMEKTQRLKLQGQLEIEEKKRKKEKRNQTKFV